MPRGTAMSTRGILGPVRVIRYTRAATANLFGDWYTVPRVVMLYYVIIDGELVDCPSLKAAVEMLTPRPSNKGDAHD
jgi:hypothetical protein